MSESTTLDTPPSKSDLALQKIQKACEAISSRHNDPNVDQKIEELLSLQEKLEGELHESIRQLDLIGEFEQEDSLLPVPENNGHLQVLAQLDGHIAATTMLIATLEELVDECRNSIHQISLQKRMKIGKLIVDSQTVLEADEKLLEMSLAGHTRTEQTHPSQHIISLKDEIARKKAALLQLKQQREHLDTAQILGKKRDHIVHRIETAIHEARSVLDACVEAAIVDFEIRPTIAVEEATKPEDKSAPKPLSRREQKRRKNKELKKAKKIEEQKKAERIKIENEEREQQAKREAEQQDLQRREQNLKAWQKIFGEDDTVTIETINDQEFSLEDHGAITANQVGDWQRNVDLVHQGNPVAIITQRLLLIHGLNQTEQSLLDRTPKQAVLNSLKAGLVKVARSHHQKNAKSAEAKIELSLRSMQNLEVLRIIRDIEQCPADEDYKQFWYPEWARADLDFVKDVSVDNRAMQLNIDNKKKNEHDEQSMRDIIDTIRRLESMQLAEFTDHVVALSSMIPETQRDDREEIATEAAEAIFTARKKGVNIGLPRKPTRDVKLLIYMQSIDQFLERVCNPNCTTRERTTLTADLSRMADELEKALD